MKPLEGKVAWVLGAGSGIGQAGALALAEDGATVVISGRRADALQETERAITLDKGKAEVAPLDIADKRAVAALAGRIAERHGRIDILVNSAGMNVTNRYWADVTPEDWDTVVAINLNGAFYAAFAVLPHMRAQGDGLIVNISSWAGRFDTYLTGPAYNATKHGLNAMSAHLNLEEGKHGIRACAICPGEVNTPILDKRPIPVPEEEKARMLQPEDLGETIRFLARLPARACIQDILIGPTWNRLTMAQPAG